VTPGSRGYVALYRFIRRRIDTVFVLAHPQPARGRLQARRDS